MKIIYTSKFEREFKNLSFAIQSIAEDKCQLFIQNPFHPSLKTHKLRGKFSDFWSFSVTYKYRIVFEFAGDETLYFHSIGTHAVYQ